MNLDVIIVGSGPGGYVAAIRASQLGLKTGIVERAEIGGICLNWGCIPTKALLKSAQVFEYIKHAPDYGITVQEYSADFKQVVKRSREVANGMSKGVQFLMKKNKIEVINGFGKLAGSGKVEVTKEDGTKETHTSKHIILATGARSRELPNIKIDNEKSVVGFGQELDAQKHHEGERAQQEANCSRDDPFDVVEGPRTEPGIATVHPLQSILDLLGHKIEGLPAGHHFQVCQRNVIQLSGFDVLFA